MSSSDMSCSVNCMNDPYMYNSQLDETSEVGFNPMQMAEARRAAEQAIQPSVDAIEQAGGDVNSPEFLAKKEEFIQRFTDEILRQATQNIRNFAGSERSKKADGSDEAAGSGGEAGVAGEASGFESEVGASEGSPLTEGSELTVGASGGSLFERIALALGTAMEDKVKQLLQAAEGVKSAGEEGVLLASAQVTARGQELNVISQAFNSTINSTGQAASTAARKQ